MSTGYTLKRLTVTNTTPDGVRYMLARLLVHEGTAKQRALDCVDKNMDGTTYDSYFEGEGFACMEPSQAELTRAKVEVSYG